MPERVSASSLPAARTRSAGRARRVSETRTGARPRPAAATPALEPSSARPTAVAACVRRRATRGSPGAMEAPSTLASAQASSRRARTTSPASAVAAADSRSTPVCPRPARVIRRAAASSAPPTATGVSACDPGAGHRLLEALHVVTRGRLFTHLMKSSARTSMAGWSHGLRRVTEIAAFTGSGSSASVSHRLARRRRGSRWCTGPERARESCSLR